MPPAPNPVPLTLVRNRIQVREPLEEIAEFEDAIVRHAGWPVVQGLPNAPFIKVTARLVHHLAAALRWVPFGPRLNGDFLSIGYVAPHYLSYKTFPFFALAGGLKAVWIYDAWENKLGEIVGMVEAEGIHMALVSSQQSTVYLNRLGLPDFRAYWLPEAVTSAGYRFKPLRARQIDLLQLGRRWEGYHAAVEPYCREKGLRYVYERKPRDWIFPSRDAFLDGLADAKVSVCVPRSVTHPEAAGRIETMTWRYLQSMASGCLILGRMPGEMRDLWDYSPLVEIDLFHPREQLQEVLDRYETYAPLIERNRAYVQQHHQWTNRIEALKTYLREHRKLNA